MTTARPHYPISTMTLAPTVGRHPRRTPKVTDPEAHPMNPFARRPRGEGLSVRERIGVLAICAAVVVLISIALSS